MSEIITKTEQNGNRTGTKAIQRGTNRTKILFDFEAFKYATGERFINDYEFIKAFVIAYNGRQISDYLKPKKRAKDNITYLSARFSKIDKDDIMDSLKEMLNYETKKIDTKTTQYRIIGVNQTVIDKEIEKAEFWAIKFA